MSVEENKAAARRFVEEALDGGDGHVLQDLFLPSAVRHFPFGDLQIETSPKPAPPGRQMKTQIHHLYGEGDFVTIHLTHRVTFGTDTNYPTRLGVLPVGGKTVSWDAMVVLLFEEDKIAEEWVNRDELHVLMQLNAIQLVP